MRLPPIAGLLLGLLPSVALATESPTHFGVGAHALLPGDVREAEPEGAGLSLWAGLPLSRYPGWSAEISLSNIDLTPDTRAEDDAVSHASLDILRHWRYGTWSPYVLTGLGAAIEEIGDERRVNPSLGLGGGLRWRPAPGQIAVRLDLRLLAQENEYRGSSGRSVLLDGRATLGLEWHPRAKPVFAPPVAPAPAEPEIVSVGDTDGDGVDDPADNCPGTPQGERVDGSGCGVEDAILLKEIEFDSGSAELDASARALLDRVAALLVNQLTGLRLEIAGHTDDRGDPDENRSLSARRASAVKFYLADQGVSLGRLVATGYGDSRPVADNATVAGREKNRRVIFRVLDER